MPWNVYAGGSVTQIDFACNERLESGTLKVFLAKTAYMQENLQ